MGNKKIKKNGSSQWKQVKIEGCIGGEGLEGFAGLEVLENYNSSFLSGDIKKRNKYYLNNELDGDIFDSGKRKRGSSSKTNDEEDECEEESASDTETEEKQPEKKKAKTKLKEKSYPGKFVLLKPPQDDDDFLQIPENSEVQAAWNAVGIDSNEIIKALIESNFKSPTEIQRLTIPVSCYGKSDIIGAAETGSGKTLAFGLPIVQCIQRRLKDNENEANELFALILTPTREVSASTGSNFSY